MNKLCEDLKLLSNQFTISRSVIAGSSLTALTLLLILPNCVSAQEDHILEITPFAGASVNFGQVSDASVDANGSDFDIAVEDGVSFGLQLGVRLSPRLTAEATSAVLPTQISSRGSSPSIGFDTDIHLLNGSLAYVLSDPARRVRPFVAAGGGVKRYSGDDFEAETDPAWNIGGGLRVQMGGATDLRVEIRDYMSSFDAVPEGEEAKFQHDVLFTTGVTFGLF